MNRALIVDDNRQNLYLLRTLLEANGFTVDEAYNGAEALVRARRSVPQLVISDLLMPVMDGYSLLREWRADAQLTQVPFIVYTATYVEAGDEKLALDLGADDFIIKPADPDDFLQHIKTVLSRVKTGGYAQPRAPAGMDEKELLQQYSKTLGNKLGDKQQQLDEQTARRLEVETALHKSENLGRLILDSTHDGIFIARDHRFVYANQSLEQMLGYPRDELTGLAFEEVVAPEYLEIWTTRYNERIAGGNPESRYEVQFMCRGGAERIWVELHAVRFEYNDQPAVLGTVKNITDRKFTLAVLQKSEERLRLALAAAHLGTFDWDMVNQRISWSRWHEELWGYAPGEFDGSYAAFAQRLHAGDLPELEAEVARCMAARERYVKEFRVVWPDGSVHWVMGQGEFSFDENGEPQRMVGVVMEITESKEAYMKIVRLNRMYKMLSEINTLIVHTNDRQQLFDAACRIAVDDGGFHMVWIGMLPPGEQGIQPVAWSGHEDGYLQHIHVSTCEDDPGRDSASSRALRTKIPVVRNDIAKDKDAVPWNSEAQARGYRAVAALPLMSANDVMGVMSLYSVEKDFFDETEMKLLEELAGDIAYALENLIKQEELEYLSSYDPLTGLPNRALFHEHLDSVLDRARKNNKRVALLVCDLKNFSHINDVYGRDTGDRILQETARRLRRLTADPVNIGRITGDYFVMILHDVGDSTGIAYEFENSFFPSLNRPFVIGDREIRIDFTCGIAVFPGDGDNAETLYNNAEAALRRAKSSGEKYLFYRHEMTERIAERLQVVGKLRTALEKEQFVLYYQPKIHSHTRQISGLEALIRWRDPETGLVPPAQFIPILEETGMMLDVGSWVIRRAASDYMKWLREMQVVPPIAVNVSAIQLRQEDFIEQIKRVISADEQTVALEIEITESLVMDNIEQNIDKLGDLQASGVQVTIDDFGTGYSSLSYIARLPANSLKIDRSFIMDMTNRPESMTLVSTIITLAHSLKLNVVAEGVETGEQARLLTLLKCNEMQGFLFSKPLPPEEIPGWLENYHNSILIE